MKFPDFLRLILLAAIWGASYIFLRIASPVLAPAFLIELRVGLAGIALVLYALVARKHFKSDGRILPFFIVGALNSAIPFTLISTATIHLTASYGAVINSTTPLFTALVAAIWLKDSLSWRRGAGLLMGLIGVVVLVGLSPLPLSGEVILSIVFALVASLCFGISGVYIKLALRNTTSLTLATWQQLTASLLLLPLAATGVPATFPSWEVVVSVLGLAFLSTSIGYLLFFRLIQSVGPTRTSTVTFLVPVFSIVWGMLFLNESVSLGMLLGFGIVLASVVLVTELKFRQPKSL
ncbi:MAG: DMT family transporter [Chloroflexi bacterium]|uniref:DMT family transporter n=1 Tax=Candidatus Chlorohelix allophototropha TaxID=3003348 RepID=A0A8T7M2H0_9CHLR|nr:DMT family transporter [Chloroflexota bacterium]WJW65587.1 DMT family transporter [Chloroflexota bacterium L227-S17]